MLDLVVGNILKTDSQLVALLQTDSKISKSEILPTMRSGDLNARAILYAITRDAWTRIEPKLQRDEQLNFMLNYLVDSFLKDSDTKKLNKYVHRPLAAGQELVKWIEHLHHTDNKAASNFIPIIASKLAIICRQSDEEVRNRILTVVLEHIFEVKDLRSYFLAWSKDLKLRELYLYALKWGTAHQRKIN